MPFYGKIIHDGTNDTKKKNNDYPKCLIMDRMADGMNKHPYPKDQRKYCDHDDKHDYTEFQTSNPRYRTKNLATWHRLAINHAIRRG